MCNTVPRRQFGLVIGKHTDMERIKVSSSTNCQVCGYECHDYQIKVTKVGSIVLDVCPKCLETYSNYIEAAKILTKIAQPTNTDVELQSPNVVVEPMQPVIQKATEVLKRMNPQYFVGVRKIKAGVSPYFGHVESGPDKDPAVININLGMVSQKAREYNVNPVVASAIVIAHEKGHVGSFEQQQGFVGGESPAEQEEKRVAAWIEQNQDRLKDLIG